ncbi:MAG: radical SAM protein [Planctomycetes bacterium]|jgi:hypothetical protein|nr:radical SAM protein [Planctomycetota bacterium]
MRTLLVQLPIPPLSHEAVRGNVPYAAGCLVLYARGVGAVHEGDIAILPSREANRLGDRALLEAILGYHPDVVGFSTYLWNSERTRHLAARLKERAPGLRIALGGPEVSPDNEWLWNAGVADHAVTGEGEAAFAALLAGPEASRPPPLASLDAVSSPYLAGVLPVEPGEPFLLETSRGCRFACRYCSYPQGYDRTLRASPERISANLRYAREHGATEVCFLDPTLNQRRDFADFLRLLSEANLPPRLPLDAELRAESITSEHARLLREAGFRELEIGLQSVSPEAQRLMGRRTPLDLFERGVRALRAEGIRAKVDLIVGLPGDTPETVRAGMRFLRDRDLFDSIQVFPLAVLPGTAFRHDAARLGLSFDPRPPYLVHRTPLLGPDDIAGLLAEAEEVFDLTFDPVPPPDFAATDGPDLARVLAVDLWREDPAIPPRTASFMTLRLSTRDAFATRRRAARLIRDLLTAEPFSGLQVILETPEPFPFDVFEAIEEAFAQPERPYHETVRSHLPGRPPTARRIAVVLPAAARAEAGEDWVRDAAVHAEVFFRHGERFVPAGQDGRSPA